MNAKIGKDRRQGLNRETKAHYLAKGRAALNPTSETADITEHCFWLTSSHQQCWFVELLVSFIRRVSYHDILIIPQLMNEVK